MRRAPTKPAPEGAEGLPRECPVCMEEIASNEAWIMFQCDHGTCVDCYTKLLQRPLHAATCPLCRTPLLETIPGAHFSAPPSLALLLLLVLIREQLLSMKGKFSTASLIDSKPLVFLLNCNS